MKTVLTEYRRIGESLWTLFSGGRSGRLWYYRAVVEALWCRTDADLIHLHVPYPLGELAYLLANRGRPLVVTYHSDVVRQWWARPLYVPMLQVVLRQARSIIATNSGERS